MASEIVKQAASELESFDEKIAEFKEEHNIASKGHKENGVNMKALNRVICENA